MAGKGTKRASSKAAGGVAKKCRTIAKAIRHADDVPKPVRAMLCNMLTRTFGTVKEERHPFQNTTSAAVGNVIKMTHSKLQAAIKDTKDKKSALDKEHEAVSASAGLANAASEAAANTLDQSKTAVTDSKTAVKDAKSHLHDLEVATKTGDHDIASATKKMETLAALVKEYLPQVRDGTHHGAAVGRHVSKDTADALEPEFHACVARTYAKALSSWGTFDRLVDTRLQAELEKHVASLTSDIAKMESEKATRASNVEAAKAAITAAEEKAKAAEEACTGAAAAAKEADTQAKSSTTTLNQHQKQIEKAAEACAHAEKELDSFEKGALAAFTEAEARIAPPPPPVEPEAPQAQA